MQICVRGNKHELIYPFNCARINKANPRNTYAWLSQMFQHPKLFQARSFRYTISCSKFDLYALSPPCWDKESRDHSFSCFVVLQGTEALWSRNDSTIWRQALRALNSDGTYPHKKSLSGRTNSSSDRREFMTPSARWSQINWLMKTAWRYCKRVGFLSVGSHFTSWARASSLLFTCNAVPITVMFCLEGRELYLIRQLRMVLLFGLRKVLVDSLVPANRRVENVSAVVVAIEIWAQSLFPLEETIEYLSLSFPRGKTLLTDLRESASKC